jgi:uncharacterized protein with PIN domain
MPTQAEIERLTREILKQSNSNLTQFSVKPFVNDQDEVWDIRIQCPQCEDREISILTEESAGNVPEQIKQKIQEHLAVH